MSAVFLQVLNMSLTASYVALFVLAARLLLKKAPKIFSYALWGIVLFRLICPFSFEGLFSLVPINPEPIPRSITYAEVPQINTGIGLFDSAVNPILSAQTVAPGAGVNPMQTRLFMGGTIWLAGIAVLLIYSAISLLRLRSKLVGAVKWRGNVYLADPIASPFVMGVLRPKIYLPSTLSKREQEYILQHERTHIRRLDHIVKIIAFLALTVHWFNPLVWAAFFLCVKDMEMCCDEAVMKRMDTDIRREYSASLLRLATGRRIIAGIPLAFGEGDTKSRIRNVLNYKRPAFWVLIVCLVTVIALCALLMLNPKQNDTLFGATYQVEEVLYEAGQYSFTYTKETAPHYSIADDHTIFEKENSPGIGWIRKGGLYRVTYSRQELYAFFLDPLNPNVSEQLDKVGMIYRADTGDDAQRFYLVMQTDSGEILMAVGYDGVGDDSLNSHVRWLYRMGNYGPDFIDFCYDAFGFSDLPPQESVAYKGELTFTAERTEFDYHIAWVRAGLFVEVGLVAQDGTEYLDTARGGSENGTIDDIPAGTYQVIVRNSERNLEYLETAAETLNIDGLVYFGYVQK